MKGRFINALHVCSCIAYLALLGWDGGISIDEFSKDSAECLDTEGQRSDVEEEDVCDITSEDTSLDSSTHGYCLIWVDRLAWGAAEKILDCVLNLNKDDVKLFMFRARCFLTKTPVK